VKGLAEVFSREDAKREMTRIEPINDAPEEEPGETAGLSRYPFYFLRPAPPDLSVFLPLHNEKDNIIPLSRNLTDSLEGLARPYEIIYVDDGSTDGSLELLRELAAHDAHVRVVSLRRNYGQTAALSAGIDHARGGILVPMDADLQNDPADIGRLLDKLEEGYDVVSGWRKDRKDKWLTRRLPSAIANALISRVSGVTLHDYGCTLKAYRRHALADVKLYGEMHRIIPIYASWAGARVAEVTVSHRAREFGKSHYSLSRVVKVLFDLLTVKFLLSYLTKPLYLFGTAGLVCLAVSTASMLLALYYRLFQGVHFNRMPAATLAMILFAMGFQFIFMGLLAEMVVRTYHETQKKPTYTVRERINLDTDDPEESG
jgi:glycosyltransferase involved in cell wall biosynthesis